MKNSLFKRAIAVVSAVPVALTQCLSVANAVSVDYTAPAAVKSEGNTAFTLDRGEITSLLYIAPEEYYVEGDGCFTKASSWNGMVYDAVKQLAGKTGTLDLTRAYNAAAEKTGEFEDVTKSFIEQMSDVTYTVTDDGKLIIEGTLDNITPTFTAGGANTIGGALKQLAADYGVEDLETPENFFDDVVIGCSVKAVLDASSLKDGTNVSATLELTDAASGKVYKGTQAIDWALESFDALKTAAKDVCDEYSQYVDTADAYKQVDESVSFYVDKLELAKEMLAKAYGVTVSFEAATGEELATNANDKIVDKVGKDAFAILSANSNKVVAMYANILEQINGVSPYAFDITIDECKDFAFDLKNIEASVASGKASFSAKFEDKEAAEVETYIESTYGVEVVEVYKTISAIADASNANAGIAIADMQIERVVIVEDVVTTTTTTGTTGSDDTTTTTTASSTGSDDTTTTTVSSTGSDDTTTTTVSSTGSDDTTTTTVSSTGSDDTTTTTTDTAGPDDTTTTTTDTAGPDDTTTTTTDSDVPGGTTTTTTEEPIGTTTSIEYKKVVNYYTETAVGFYLDTDTEFDFDRVKSITYTIDEVEITYGENGVKLNERVVSTSAPMSIIDSVEFKDTPADLDNLKQENSVNQFAFQVEIYAAKDIVAADGYVVAKAGDKLTNANGNTVSATAYIGVKGDADLDMTCSSADASIVLSWYARKQSGGDITRFNESNKLIDEYPLLDDFAAFLADVDNENDAANSYKVKGQRTIDSGDSSFILAYYAKVSTGHTPGKATWDAELKDYAKK